MSGIPRGYTDCLSNREEFSLLLRSFRERAGRARYGLAKEVGCDPSYLTRIEQGDREPPRYHIVDALARALRLSITDRNRLLVAGGFAPTSLMLLGRWDESLQEVTDVLADPLLDDDSRERFRTIIHLLAMQLRLGARPLPWTAGQEVPA